VASLLKQFLRELPDPLLTSALYDVFIQCIGVGTAEVTSSCLDAVLLACLLLPDTNLSTLRYLLSFLMRVAAASERNRMDASNLAVCLAPNLLSSDHHASSSSVTDGVRLETETTVIQLLIENAAHVGMVPDSVFERASLLNACFSLAAESDVGRTMEVAGDGKVTKKKKRKRRSGSLQGVVLILCSPNPYECK